MKQRFLAYRDYNGLGDWMMSASVLKHVNHQFPELEIHCHLNSRQKESLITEVLLNTQCGVTQLIFDENRSAVETQYDFVSGHISYPPHRKQFPYHCIEGMVRTVSENTGLPLVYRPKLFARFQAPPLDLKLPNKFILMVSGGKWQRHRQGGKDWGYCNFNALCDALVQSGHRVIQVGSKGDRKLKAATQHFLGENLSTLSTLMHSCWLFIGIDDGLCHFAGHHGVRSLIIYCRHQHNYRNTWYPKQTPVVGRSFGPEVLLSKIRDLKKSEVRTDRKRIDQVQSNSF